MRDVVAGRGDLLRRGAGGRERGAGVQFESRGGAADSVIGGLRSGGACPSRGAGIGADPRDAGGASPAPTPSPLKENCTRGADRREVLGVLSPKGERSWDADTSIVPAAVSFSPREQERVTPKGPVNVYP
jgi:hypothetical protein